MISFPLHPGLRIGLNVLLLLAGVVALRLGESVIVPMLIALLLASVLGPAASWLQDTLKIRWTLACVTVIVTIVLANLMLTMAFSIFISRLAAQIPNPNDRSETAKTERVKLYKDLRFKIETIWPGPIDDTILPKDPDDISDIRIIQLLSDAAPRIAQDAVKYTGFWLWQWILILFILLFVLLEGRMLARRVVEIIGPSEEIQAKASGVLLDMAKQVRTYLVWRTIINFGLAIVMGLIYQTAGLKQAWTWAIMLAILNYIPYLGPLIAGILPFFDAFLSASPAAALVVTIVYGVVIVLEGYLVVPLLMGRSMDLNATTVMLACLFWELVWGMTGLFLAMPIMAGIKAILYHVPEWRVWANLMSSTDGDPNGAPLIVSDDAIAPSPPPAELVRSHAEIPPN